MSGMTQRLMLTFVNIAPPGV